MRIKRAVNAVKKRRKVLKSAKGYWGARSRLYRVAKQAVMSLIYNAEKEFNLKPTYKQIKASVVPKNTISKNLFFDSGFTSFQYDGEYLVYTKYFQKNYDSDITK